MRFPFLLFSLAAGLLAAPAAAVEPPGPTLAQVEKALERSDPKSVARPMKATTRAVVSKPDGSAREETLAETIGHGDGTAETTTLRAIKDGKDVTAERRAEEARERARRAATPPRPQPTKEAGAKKEGNGSSTELTIPSGEDRKYFVFGEAVRQGDLLVAPYEPARGAKAAQLTRGRIGWNPSTGEPAFIEMQLVDPPTGVKELRMRAEFAGAGDAIYTRLLATSGVGGILWIKRKFEVTVEMAPLSGS